MRCFVKELPPTSNKPIANVEAMKPTITSASFHMNGSELAITVAGDNLWFSTSVKVGPFQQKVSADNTSQKSLQFNTTVEGKKQFSGVSDSVSVKIWSQFTSKPVINNNTEVKRKVNKLAIYSMVHAEGKGCFTGIITEVYVLSPHWSDSLVAMWIPQISL